MRKEERQERGRMEEKKESHKEFNTQARNISRHPNDRYTLI